VLDPEIRQAGIRKDAAAETRGTSQGCPGPNGQPTDEPPATESTAHETKVISHLKAVIAGMTEKERGRSTPQISERTGAGPAGGILGSVDLVVDLAVLMRLISDSEVPSARLVEGLLTAAWNSIPWAQRMWEEYPQRNPAAERNYLIARQEDCRNILTMLDDLPTILAIQARSGTDDPDGHSSAFFGLERLIAQLADAIANTPEKKGPHKAYPGTSPQLACALFVAEAWRSVHGALPPHTSDRVQQACEQLWKLTGLHRARAGGTQQGWRPHLLQAKKALEDGRYPNVADILGGREGVRSRDPQR
jgi:hypothetical protein